MVPLSPLFAPDSEDLRILDDSPIGAPTLPLGTRFSLYHDGRSVEFEVTEIVEHNGRRIAYGMPVST